MSVIRFVPGIYNNEEALYVILKRCGLTTNSVTNANLFPIQILPSMPRTTLKIGFDIRLQSRGSRNTRNLKTLQVEIN